MQLLEGIKMAPAKKMLCLSLFQLLSHSRLDDIPTKRIYESGGISANSFYYHFRDKYDCACYLFRIILFQAMGGETSSPERILEDMRTTRPLPAALGEQTQDDARPHDHLEEKWHEHWYDMICYTRQNARTQFLHLLQSRAPSSPYYELKEVWEHNFQQAQSGVGKVDARHSDFLKEALHAIFDLFMVHFFFGPEDDFQRADVERMIRMRRHFYDAYLKEIG